MDRLTWGIVIAVFALLLLLAMFLAWRARLKRQRTYARTTEAPAARGAELVSVPVLYVATTPADDPLNRLTIPGLAFRGRATVTVYESGISIAVKGELETFITRDRLRSVGTSTWTIDRTVETGGLTRIDWTFDTADGPADVESYVRATEPTDQRRLIIAAAPLVPQPAAQEGNTA